MPYDGPAAPLLQVETPQTNPPIPEAMGQAWPSLSTRHLPKSATGGCSAGSELNSSPSHMRIHCLISVLAAGSMLPAGALMSRAGAQGITTGAVTGSSPTVAGGLGRRADPSAEQGHRIRDGRVESRGRSLLHPGSRGRWAVRGRCAAHWFPAGPPRQPVHCPQSGPAPRLQTRTDRDHTLRRDRCRLDGGGLLAHEHGHEGHRLGHGHSASPDAHPQPHGLHPADAAGVRVGTRLLRRRHVEPHEQRADRWRERA